MKKVTRILLLFAALAVVSLFLINATEDQNMKETAFFKADLKKREIVSLVNVTDRLSLRYISVTTDEQTYWPNEDVFLKVLLPAHPGVEIEVTLSKKDATPQKLGKFTLSDAGMLVRKIASGKEKRLEPGEYIIEVKTTDGKLTETATYSVVEGALGALSFAYDFTAITDPAKLDNAKGAWYFGNAGGIGKRWGNGLNVKNEVRYLNQPYTGTAKIMTRCYLAGCNGVEAGPAKEQQITNGLLETVLDVGGHSGPFGIDVITDKGSVSYVFGKSGHVERQTIIVSGGMGNAFEATLAPYENTVAVFGRDIYIAKGGSNKDDAFEIASVIADRHGEVEIYVRKKLDNPRLFVVYPDAKNAMKAEEIALGKILDAGKRLLVKCRSPYSFIAIGGFDKDALREGWAIAFTESDLGVTIDSRSSGLPSKQFEIGLRTTSRASGKGIQVSGVLEVFDNRVQSKSAKEQLVSAIGDSTREFSNYLTYWRDTTGIDEEVEFRSMDKDDVKGSSYAMKEEAPAPIMLKKSGPVTQISQESSTGVEIPEEQETIREGEKKVVYCGLVTTNANGDATVSVELPPQTGRVKVRFVAVSVYDYTEQVKDVDVKKDSFIEVSLQPMIVPDARVVAKAVAVNETNGAITLSVTGAGLEKELSFQVKPGANEFDVPLVGKTYGKIRFRLSDAGGKALDTREIELRNIGSYPVTFSDVTVSDGKGVSVPAGRRFAAYANPAMLMDGMVSDIVTSMYSWFGHAESLSSQAAIRAILLASMDAKLIGDKGKRETLKSDLAKAVKDLYDAFYDKNTKLFSPYPGIATSDLWSMWVSKNLSKTIGYLEGSNALKTEFKTTIALAREMTNGVKDSFKKRKVNTQELGQYDLENGTDTIPIEINGQVVFKVIMDGAVADWFVKKMMPLLDMPRSQELYELNKNFVKAFDTYRFLRSFERAGVYYYLAINAKALYLKNDPAFAEVFNKIARGAILTQEPGIIKGPALLGGVYSSPASVSNFLDLLLLMAKDKKFSKTKVAVDGKEYKLGEEPYVSEVLERTATVKADQYTVLRIDNEKVINMYDYASRDALATATVDKAVLSMGGRTYVSIELAKALDPSEYYAIVAAPSVVSIKQTEDLLSDYKGQLIYGQRSSGGEKIQLIATPFRGKARMLIEVEATQKGSSEGFVLVRHISNPDIICTVKIPKIMVQ